MIGYANEHQIHILLIQDYYKKNNRIWSTPSNWFSYQSTDNTAAIIITKKDLLPNLTYQDQNSVFVNILTTEGPMTVGSIYSRPSAPLQQDMNWINNFSPLQRIIVGADLNARLSLLGYRAENEKGRVFSHILQSKNLILINDPESPATFVGQPTQNRSGTPDVTFCTQDIVDYISSWYVDTETETCSDHRYINLSVSITPKITNIYRYKTKYSTFKKFNL